MRISYANLLWLLVPASLFIHFANLGGLSIYALDEAKNATAAIEMWEKGEWLLPTFNHQPRYEKPPLHYYAFILAYKWFGITPWAARFFPALLGFATVWMIYGFVRHHLDKKTAFWTAFILTCSPHWIIQFHMAVPDAFLIFFLTCALFAFYSYITQSFMSKATVRTAFCCLGLAVLSKGPVALVLSGIIILLFFLLDRKVKIRELFKVLDPIGIFLLLAITLPWYLAIAVKTDGQWLSEFIFKHNIGRFSAPMEGHGGGAWKTLLFVVAGLLPFSPLVLIQFGKLRSALTAQNRLLHFSLIGAAVIIGFFMVSGTKLPNYTVPAYPFIAVILGYHIKHLLQRGAVNSIRLFGGIGLLFFLAVCITPYFVFQADPIFKPMIEGTYPLLLLAGLALPAYMYFLVRKEAFELLLYVGMCFFGISVTFFYFSMPIIDRFGPVISADLEKLKSAQVYYYRNFNSAFSFYLQKPINNIESAETLDGESYVISREEYLPAFDLLELPYEVVHRKKDLFENPVSVVLKVTPAPL
jgi:4-amino-4-deoxy-L-arabinose transferase-like glycosyltransferase